MWTVTVLIVNARATKDVVACDIRFTANGGPFSGASLEKQFMYTHPTSTYEIVQHLTDYANQLKVSFEAPGELEGRTWEV